MGVWGIHVVGIQRIRGLEQQFYGVQILSPLHIKQLGWLTTPQLWWASHLSLPSSNHQPALASTEPCQMQIMLQRTL